MQQAWLDELSEFLRIPSVSADSSHAEDVARAGEWVCERIRSAGGEAGLVDWEGQPLAVGEIQASGNGSAPTVLCYGHFDVQPPAPLDLWESPPFEATVRDGWLYGRGVADDKGQLYLLLKAAEELAAEGRLPVNLRFACDGEEETGGHSIVDFLAEDDRGADACVIFDSDMVAQGRPAFNVATRGLCYFHLKVRTGARDLRMSRTCGSKMQWLVQTSLVISAKKSRNQPTLRHLVPLRQHGGLWRGPRRAPLIDQLSEPLLRVGVGLRHAGRHDQRHRLLDGDIELDDLAARRIEKEPGGRVRRAWQEA